MYITVTYVVIILLYTVIKVANTLLLVSYFFFYTILFITHQQVPSLDNHVIRLLLSLPN